MNFLTMEDWPDWAVALRNLVILTTVVVIVVRGVRR